MTLTASDKTTFTKYPPLPSKCVICLRDSNGEIDFVDFQMSVDVYGAVVICTDCMIPVALEMGFINKSDADALTEQVESLKANNRELAEANARLNSTIDSIITVRPDLVERSVLADAESDKDSGINSLTLDLDLE